MKKPYVFLLVLIITLAMGSLFATSLLTDDFSGTVGTALTANGWTLHSGGGTPILISTPSLTYSNWVGSGVGNAATTGGTSDDVNKAFTSTNSGSLYLAFMYKPTSASTTTDYPIMLGATAGTSVTSFYGKLYVQRDASNNVRFGITKTTAASAVYTGYTYSLNTTYLMVIRYDFIAGTGNDQAFLFIDPTIGGTEPSPTVSCTGDTGTDPAQLISVALRQGTTTAGAVYDGIRVGTTWADVAATSASVIEPTAQPTSLTFNNVTTTSFDVSFTAASPAADGYIAVRKTGSAPTTDPVDGTAYTAGTTLGDGTVVFSGSSTSFGQSSLTAGTAYYYKVYSFNGSGGTTNYLLTSPLAGNQSTTAGATPTITLSTATLTGFNYTVGSGPSTTQTFTVSGSDLTADISISAPTNYEISKSSGSGYTSPLTFTQSGGTVSTTTVYVRLKAGLSVANYNSEVITASSTGATNQTVTCSGSVSAITAPAAPVATAASGITSDSFTSNWNSSAGATSYRLDVYTGSSGTVSDLFISEYIEGSSSNKYIEIYNGTGASVDLSNYKLQLYTNGSATVSNEVTLSGTLANGACAVYKNSSAALTLPDGVTATTSTAVNFNGDDAVALYKISTSSYVDIFGKIGEDPGASWGTTPLITVDKTLVRKSSVTGGVVTNPTSGFPTLATEWDSYAVDTATYLGSHSVARSREITYVPNFQNLNVGNVYTYPVTGLTAGTEYHYVVRGVNDGGTSANSNVVNVTTSSAPITEPTAQPTSLVFSSVGSNSFTVSYTASSPASDGYIAVRKTGSAPTSNPVDGTSYTVGNAIGDGTVVYSGSGVTFSQSSLSPSTTYYYKVYSYNGSDSNTNYLTTSPLAGSQATTASDPFGGYYTPVSGLSGDNLKSGLHTLIKNTHTTEFSYTATTDQIKYIDEDSLNTNNIIQIYTGWSMPKANYGSGTTDWNKEHTWSKSHGGFEDNPPAGTDLHHLRPSDSTVNSQKSNRDFDEGATLYTDASPYPGYDGNTGCYYSTNIWEPRDADKGDVARMIFYMATRYEGTDTSYDLEIVDYTNSSPSGQPLYGKLSTLLAWHQADPPDSREMRRNNRTQERQGNRNPFIDHPEYVSSIWGGVSAPSVTTAAITSIGTTTATGGGEVTDIGSAAVTARGVCWNTTGNPTTADSYTTNGTGIGTFVSSLTGLTSGQFYYVRAYATNLVNTTYGNEVTFTALKAEPAAHVTSFAAGTPAYTSIPLTWTDVANTDGYLIKGSSVGYGDITAPSDGTAESNATLVRNVTQGTQNYTFTGLNSNTTYYFMIYPYTNSGTSINYKTDGSVPQATAQTTNPPVSNLLLEENFVYTQGTYLHDNGWTAHSGAGTTPPIVGDENLTYPDYPSTGGLCGHIVNTGEDVHKTFTAQTSGSVYASLLVKVTGTTPTGDYFFHFAPSPAGSDYKGRLFAGKDGSNNLRFGITKSANVGTPVAWTGYDYALDTTYLVVLKYTIVDGTANDVVIGWINPSITGTEPTAQLSAVVSETDIGVTGVGSVAIRQSSSSITVKLDGIRVGTSWADLFPSDSPLISAIGTINPFSTLMGTPSASQSYTVTGINLTSDITVTAPTGFELSLTNSRTWSTSVQVPQTDGTANSTVYIRYNPSVAGPHSGNITHTATGAVTVNKAVSGTTYAGELVVTGSISAFSTTVGTPSAAQTYNLAGVNLSNYIDVVVTGPFQIRDTMHPTPTWETTLYLAPDYVGDIDVRYNPTEAGSDTGTITHSTDGSEAENVVINLSGTATLPYGINATPDVLNFTADAGSTSQVQSYALSGSNLTQNIIILAPDYFEIATSSSGPWVDSLNVASTFNDNIYVRFAPATAGTINDFITNDSGDAYKDITITGVASLPSTPMNIQAGQTLTRDFDVIGTSATATLPTDWRVAKSVTAADLGTWAAGITVTDRVGGNALTSSAGNGIYNYGAGVATTATDRAIGFLSSSSATKTGNLYTKVTNTGAATITSLDISYKAEKYRTGTNAAGFSIKTYYSLDGSSWTEAGEALKASWAADATTDGYVTAPGDTQTKSGLIAVEVPQNSSVYLAWSYGVSSGTTTSFAQGLGVDDVSITAYATQIASTPTFDPAPGSYLTAQNVTLQTTTNGATIYYTTDGNTPTTSSAVYSTPIAVTATTTIKAIAVAAGHENSPVGTGTYILPVGVANIAALRTMPTGTAVYKLNSEAILTLKSSTRNSKYIQDATGAVLIDDVNGIITTSYNLGDGITGIMGTLGYYTGMLQFTPVADPGAPTSTNNTITPQTVTLADLNPSYQGKLVKVANVSITGTGNFATVTNYNISDGTNTGVLRTHYADLDYIGTAIPTTPKTITGVILQYTVGTPAVTTMQLVPRSLAEFTDSSAPDAPVNVTITIVGDDVQLDWDADPSIASWNIYASDDPTTGFGLTPLATSSTNSKLLVNEAASAKRFYFVRAVR